MHCMMHISVTNLNASIYVIYAYGISVVHLDIHTCTERSCTLKPINGFIAVISLCSPSLKCST